MISLEFPLDNGGCIQEQQLCLIPNLCVIESPITSFLQLTVFAHCVSSSLFLCIIFNNSAPFIFVLKIEALFRKRECYFDVQNCKHT